MYQPKLGRFLSRDPMPENGVTLLSPVPDMTRYWQDSAYAYVRNNPVNLADPSGMDPVNQATATCKNKKWKPLKPKDCKYGPNVGFEADFVMYDRDRDRCEMDCDPHIMQRFGATGACTARVNWPLDCVCKNMPDNTASNCIRGCLRCVFDEKGSAADLDEHTWCIEQCTTLVERYRIYQQLDVAIHCCAKKQGVIVGPGSGKKPGPAKPPATLTKVDCDQCGAGPTRPIDCSGY